MAEKEYPYQTINKQKYPIVPTILHRLGKTVYIDALIDSGADFCCFKPDVASELGLPVERGTAKTIITGSGEITAYMHEIEIQLLEKRIKCKVAFSREFRLYSNVLGRLGFFEAHEITFKERDKLMSIKEL